MPEAWYRWDGEDLILAIHVQPNASRDMLAGTHGDRLKLKIMAPPTDGRANNHLVRFLARLFGVPCGRVELLSGQASRSKRVRIHQPRTLPGEIREPAD